MPPVFYKDDENLISLSSSDFLHNVTSVFYVATIVETS